MHAPYKDRKTSIKKKLALSLGVGVGFLLLLELGATLHLGDAFKRGEFKGNHWIAVGQRDSRFGWSNRPGASAHINAKTFAYRAQINSLGLRDPERPHAKPEGIKRVVLLGDSVTWGWGDNRGERFSDFLE